MLPIDRIQACAHHLLDHASHACHWGAGVKPEWRWRCWPTSAHSFYYWHILGFLRNGQLPHPQRSAYRLLEAPCAPAAQSCAGAG